MPRADWCGGCGEFNVTVEVSDGGRACIRCLRTYFYGAELRKIIADDDAREDERARALGLMDGEGFIVVGE